MFTVLDTNNFWSPSGGGVRRYLLEKIAFFRERDDVHYVFVQNDTRRYTESLDGNVTIEHIAAGRLPGGGDYRALLTTQSLQPIVDRHQPDVIECGSPYVLPFLTTRATRKLRRRPALIGFWHADFPRTYAGRKFGDIHPALARPAEAAAWWWARRGYGAFDAIFVASRWVARNMAAHGLDRLYYTPLGVDADTFSPVRRDQQLVAELEDGQPGRPILFFPHRFQAEKGLRTFVDAYERLRASVDVVPAVVFAGTGPEVDVVRAVAAKYPRDVRYIGYVDTPQELARWYASSSISVALSAFETFGLSCAEAMASGLAMVAADQGAAAELVSDADAGLTIPYGDSQALARALASLIREDLLRERGLRGRAWVEQFTWTDCFSRELACYREIVELVRSGRHVPPGLHERGDIKSSTTRAHVAH